METQKIPNSQNSLPSFLIRHFQTAVHFFSFFFFLRIVFHFLDCFGDWPRDYFYCLILWIDLALEVWNLYFLCRGSLMNAAAAAKSLQSCPTLCDPIDSSPPGSPVPGILQARTLEWVAISFSSAGKWKVKVKSLSHFRLFVTPWTAAYQAPLSMGFSRQEYWSGVPLPSPSLMNTDS